MNKLQTGISAGPKSCRTCALFCRNVPALTRGDINNGPNCCGSSYLAGCSFWHGMPQPEPRSLGEMTVKITINKDEILRDLDEILKKADEVSEAIDKIHPCPAPTYPFWPNPDTTDGEWIVTCETVSIGDGSSTTVTYKAVPSTPTGE